MRRARCRVVQWTSTPPPGLPWPDQLFEPGLETWVRFPSLHTNGADVVIDPIHPVQFENTEKGDTMTIDRSKLTYKVRAPMVAGDDTAASWQERLLAAHNKEREKAGVRTLALDDRLSIAAQRRADHMGANGYFSHDNAAGGPGEWWRILNEMGVKYRLSGENLATNNAQDNVAVAMTGLMNSPSHRENILLPQYTHVGFGVQIYTTPVPGKYYSHVLVCIFGELTN